MAVRAILTVISGNVLTAFIFFSFFHDGAFVVRNPYPCNAYRGSGYPEGRKTMDKTGKFPLTDAETEVLVAEMVQGSIEARNKLWESSQEIIKAEARKCVNRINCFNELVIEETCSEFNLKIGEWLSKYNEVNPKSFTHFIYKMCIEAWYEECNKANIEKWYWLGLSRYKQCKKLLKVLDEMCLSVDSLSDADCRRIADKLEIVKISTVRKQAADLQNMKIASLNELENKFGDCFSPSASRSYAQDPLAVFLMKEKLAGVQNVVNNLPEKQRIYFNAIAIDGETQTAVAAKYNVSTQNVNGAYNTALNKIKKYLNDFGITA